MDLIIAENLDANRHNGLIFLSNWMSWFEHQPSLDPFLINKGTCKIYLSLHKHVTEVCVPFGFLLYFPEELRTLLDDGYVLLFFLLL